MCKNIVKPGRPQVTIWRMGIACLITKATNTHAEYILFIAFPLQKLLKARASLLRYSFNACRVCEFFQLLQENDTIYIYIYNAVLKRLATPSNFHIPLPSILPFLRLFHSWLFISYVSRFFGDGLVFFFLPSCFQLIIIFGNRVGSILST